MASLGWLHLSDLHQGLNGQGWLWPNVRDLFFEDLVKLHRVCGPWDLILFTGDLTQSGKMEEFVHLTNILAELQEHLSNMGSDPVLLAVPGNHDLLRPSVKNPAVRVLKGWDLDPEVQDEFWRDPDCAYRRLVTEAFTNYVKWWRSLPERSQLKMLHGPLPGDFSATLDKNGVQLGVVGLNSAFLQLTGAPMEGKLALGPAQFHESCGGDGARWVRERDVCLLMTHHPPGWFSKAAQDILRGEIASPGRFAVHLFGHMHEGQSQTLLLNGAAPLRTWQGPSLFGLERWGDGQPAERRHGYTAGRIKLEDDRAYLRLWPRVAVRRSAGYFSIVPDVNTFELEEDSGTRPEEFPLRRRMARQPTTTLSREDTTAVAGLKRPVRVIILYAPVDAPFARELEMHLAILRRQNLVETWDESRIAPGTDRNAVREQEFAKADVMLFLVSSNLLSSDYLEELMHRAVVRHQHGTLRVIPIQVRPVFWEGSALSHIQPLPDRPVSSFEERDQAWLDVARGLRSVIQSIERSRVAMSSSTSSPQTILSIGDIFRTSGIPESTYVAPSQLDDLEVYLATMGQGLVVEGPSGIGKTTATRKALEKVKSKRPLLYVASKDPSDIVKLDSAIVNGFTGHLLVDDFHHLDDDRKAKLAALIKIMADKNRRDAKLTLIGINPVGDSLVAGFPDLTGRFETVSLQTQPSEKLQELIRKGEAAANIRFLKDAEFIINAAGSFFTTQQLCFHAARAYGVKETQQTLVEIPLGPLDVLKPVLSALSHKYYKPLSHFAATDAVNPPRGATLALLWLLGDATDGHVSLHDARMRFAGLIPALDWLRDGHLAQCLRTIPQLSGLLYYQESAGVLSAEDPQLKFYLRNIDWSDFIKRTGNQARLNATRGLIFV